MSMETSFTIKRYKDADGNLLTEKERNEKLQNGSANESSFEEIEIELVVEYNGKWVDEGIGWYEYWGCKGNDVHWVYEVEDFESATDDEYEEWKDRLTDEEIEAIIEHCARDGEKYDCDEQDDCEYYR